MRLLIVVSLALLAACAPAPPPVESSTPDPTMERWYGETLERLTLLNRKAEGLLRSGKFEEVAAIITEGQPLMTRLLSVSRPTLAAVEAASDLDDLYGRMLLANRHYGWARMFFQKNLARWKNWTPQTEETARRKQVAESAIAECDRLIAK